MAISPKKRGLGGQKFFQIFFTSRGTIWGDKNENPDGGQIHPLFGQTLLKIDENFAI